jgi:hypothetical protein
VIGLDQLARMLREADAFGFTPIQRAYAATQLLSRHATAQSRCRQLLRWMLTAQLLLSAKGDAPLLVEGPVWTPTPREEGAASHVRSSAASSAHTTGAWHGPAAIEEVDESEYEGGPNAEERTGAADADGEGGAAATPADEERQRASYWSHFVERPVSLRRILNDDVAHGMCAVHAVRRLPRSAVPSPPLASHPLPSKIIFPLCSPPVPSHLR